MKPLRVIPFLALLFLLPACASSPLRPDARLAPVAAPVPAEAPFVNARAIIIIRHADIDIALKARLGNATPLTDAGKARAQELLPALRDAGITRIITSVADRTQLTAAPLAAELHLVPENPFGHGAESAPAGLSEGQVVYRYLAGTARPGETILLVHHHSVIPSLMAEFGFPKESPIVDAAEFDRVYVLLPDAQHRTYQLLRLRYNGKW